jgi:hypothetical protein
MQKAFEVQLEKNDSVSPEGTPRFAGGEKAVITVDFGPHCQPQPIGASDPKQ